MQINLDIIVAMRCPDLRVNMQDAAGDRTLAGDLLRHDPTNWAQWTGRKMERGMHELGKDDGVNPGWEELWDVHEQLGKAKTRRFSKTPRVRGAPNACRIYGSLDGNKVQGDFHITARGHGYQDLGDHLDHTSTSSPSHRPWFVLHIRRITNNPQHSTSPTSSAKCPLGPTTPPSPTHWTTPSP
jgi:hypothetical protein